MSESDRDEALRAFEAWVAATSRKWSPTDAALAYALCRVLDVGLTWNPETRAAQVSGPWYVSAA